MSKSLGFWRLWALVVGSMIGTGIFLLPTVLAPYGSLSLLGWIFAGGGTLSIALTLGSLARRIPALGGPYAYTRATMGDLPGFLIGWGHWASYWISTAAMGVAAVGYLGFFVPSISSVPIYSAATALVVMWLFTGINVAGVRSAGVVQLVTTLLKLLPLFAIAGTGLLIGDITSIPAENPEGLSPLGLISQLILLTMWAYVGVESGTIPAEDVVEPQKNIPRALFVGTLTVTAVYILATYGVMSLIPPSELMESTSPFADAASVIFGPWGAGLVALGALISIFGALNGNVLVCGMLPRALAKDKLFPARFETLNRLGAPGFALIVSGFLASALIASNFAGGLVAVYTLLIILATLTSLLPYAASAVAELILQRRDAASGKWNWRATIIAVGALGFSVFALIGAGLKEDLYGLILLAAGLPIYYLMKRKGSDASH